MESLEEIKKILDELRMDHLRLLMRRILTVENLMRSSEERKSLMKTAIENCTDETVLKWLKENSESADFFTLVDIFHFLKKHIEEEEKKNHSDCVDITFVAHGAIREPMIPASCLLPLSTVTDVVLYTPWNCISDSNVVYGVATGRMQPQHRAFTCETKASCQTPDPKHRPKKLPNCWNSMKRAGDQMIPNITLSPLKPEHGVWKSFENLTKKFGQPERNRIVIPFNPPADSWYLESVPFSVVMLAFSLVLLPSRFQATVHLATCLGDQSVGLKLEKEPLNTQYSWADDHTSMTCDPETFAVKNTDYFSKWFFWR